MVLGLHNYWSASNGRPICSLLPFQTVCRVAWIEHDTITVTEPSQNIANNIVHPSRTLLACEGEMRLLNRSTLRLPCEMQKIKTQKKFTLRSREMLWITRNKKNTILFVIIQVIFFSFLTCISLLLFRARLWCWNVWFKKDIH